MMSESPPSQMMNNTRPANSQYDILRTSPIAQILGFGRKTDTSVPAPSNRALESNISTIQKSKLIKKSSYPFTVASFTCNSRENSSDDFIETDNSISNSNNQILYQKDFSKNQLPKSKSNVVPILSIPEKENGFVNKSQPLKPDTIESPHIIDRILTISPTPNENPPPLQSNILPDPAIISNKDKIESKNSNELKNSNNNQSNNQSPIADFLRNSPSPSDFYNCYNSNLPFDPNISNADDNSIATSPMNDFLLGENNEDLNSTRKFRLTELPLPLDIKDRIIFLNKEYCKTKTQLHDEIDKLKMNYSAEQQRCKVELTSLIMKHKTEMKEKFEQNTASKPSVLEVKTVNGSVCIATPKTQETSPFSNTAPPAKSKTSIKIHLGPPNMPRPKSRIPVLSLRQSKSQKTFCPPSPTKYSNSPNSSATATENNTSNSSSSNYSSASSCCSTENYTGFTIQGCETPKMKEERKSLVDRQKREIFDLNQKCSERLAKVKADHEDKIFPLQDKINVISAELKSMGHNIEDHDIHMQMDEVNAKKKKMAPNRQLHIKALNADMF